MSNDIWYKEPGWYALGLAVLSLIVSGISLYFTWWANYHAKREDVARALLSDGLAVHALSEAWILEGPAYRGGEIVDKQKPYPTASGFHFMATEG